MKNKLAIFFVTIIFLSTGTVAAAAQREFTFTPQVGIPGSEFQVGENISVGETKNGTTSSTLLADYIRSFYIYALNILGVLAVLILMAGGVQWIISGGNTKKIESAKKMISGSLFGSFLLLGSYFILNTINPNLTKLPAIEMRSIEYVDLGCCDKALKSGKAEMISSQNCEEKDFHPDGYGVAGEKCEPYICCIEYNNDAKDLVKACSKKLAKDCSGSNMSVGAGECNELPACNGASVTDANCAGVKNGEEAKETDQAAVHKIKYWCFNGKLYTGAGTVGEPCGTKEGSLCFSLSDGESCNRDWASGGRNCDNSTCCEAYADGTIKK
ncbi:MAG: pilin [Patescibacteria group bacterium]|jgi:hypothetical protein